VDSAGADPSDLALAVDPQTSGGLLLAVPQDALADYLSAVPEAVEIGVVEAAGNQQIRLE
jgi:selenophosphate synthase